MSKASVIRRLLPWFVVVVLAGCGGRHTVVLLPDPDGHVGAAELSNERGSRRLDQAGTMTRIERRGWAPSDVATAAGDFLRKSFGEVLAIEPPPPEKFVLYFQTGSIQLMPESEKLLDDIVAATRRRHAVAIDLAGHTDTAGSDEQNELLSLARAESIRLELDYRRAEYRRLAVAAYGQKQPAVPTADGVYQPRNRRVEVTVR